MAQSWRALKERVYGCAQLEPRQGRSASWPSEEEALGPTHSKRETSPGRSPPRSLPTHSARTRNSPHRSRRSALPHQCAHHYVPSTIAQVRGLTWALRNPTSRRWRRLQRGRQHRRLGRKSSGLWAPSPVETVQSSAARQPVISDGYDPGQLDTPLCCVAAPIPNGWALRPFTGSVPHARPRLLPGT